MKVMQTKKLTEDKTPKFITNSLIVIILLLQVPTLLNYGWRFSPETKQSLFFFRSALSAIGLALALLSMWKYIKKQKAEVALLELHDNELGYLHEYMGAAGPQYSQKNINLAKINKIELHQDLIVFEGERYFSQATYFPKNKFAEVEVLAKAMTAKNPSIALIYCDSKFRHGFDVTEK